MNKKQEEHLNQIKEEKQKEAEELYEQLEITDDWGEEYFHLLKTTEESDESEPILWTRLSNSSSMFHTIN